MPLDLKITLTLGVVALVAFLLGKSATLYDEYGLETWIWIAAHTWFVSSIGVVIGMLHIIWF